MVCALCEFTPALAHAEAARLCPAVLLSIDDADPLVLAPVWEAVLHVVSTIPVRDGKGLYHMPRVNLHIYICGAFCSYRRTAGNM